MANQTITDLWQRFFAGSISPEEKKALAAWIEESAQDDELKTLIEHSWSAFEVNDRIPADEADRMLTTILQRAKNPKMPAAPVVPVKKYLWRRVAVAASILLVVGLGSYLIFKNKTDKEQVVTATPAKDIESPGSAKAVITLANGQRVYLDSAANGALASEGNVQIVKDADGKISYSGSATEVVYNTLSNPRGSRVINMTLTDGSRVWLNAGSSITYPVAFAGNERKVTMNGEAYFEIAHNAVKPFKVSKGGTEVAVLGTHFNVNAYDDEPGIKVTLLEGSVKVSTQYPASNILPGYVMLKPGEQALVNGSAIQLVSPDLEQVMAWKNGIFQFNDDGIEPVMREIARWYDVEVIYQERPAKTFKGSLDRNMSAANIFRILEETGGVHFKIDGKKITVLK
jgi:transmembrane sensor